VRCCYRFVELHFETFSLRFGAQAVEHTRRRHVDRAFEREAHDPELRTVSARCPGPLDNESFSLFVHRLSLWIVDAIRAPCFIECGEELPDNRVVNVWDVIAWNGTVARFYREAGASWWDLVVAYIPPRAVNSGPERRWTESVYQVRDAACGRAMPRRSNVQYHLPRQCKVDIDSLGVPGGIDPSGWSPPAFLWTIGTAAPCGNVGLC
jgi:hypothetical protein